MMRHVDVCDYPPNTSPAAPFSRAGKQDDGEKNKRTRTPDMGAKGVLNNNILS
jgi:hypothetical protein